MSRGRRRVAWVVVCACAVLAVTLAVFSSVLRADFVFWDDDIVIYRNPLLTSPGLDAVRWAFTDVHSMNRFIPAALLSFSAVYGAFGLDPFGYHLASWLLHGASAVLLFLVLARLLSRRAAPDDAAPAGAHAPALVASLLWAIHPLRAEPVAWASALSYCLATWWLLVSTLLYLEAHAGPPERRRRRRSLLALSVLAYALSVTSQVVGVTFWAVLVVLDVLVLGRVQRLRGRWSSPAARAYLVEKAAFLLPAALALGANVLVQIWFGRPSEPRPSPADFGLVDRAMQAAYLATQYLLRQLWPADLAPIYADLISFDPLSARFVARALGLAAVVGAALLLRRRWPGAAGAVLAYLLMALPVLGLLEHPYLPSDRYSHVSSLALAAALAFVVRALLERARSPAVAVALLLAASIPLSVATSRQVAVWHDTESLLAHTAAVSSDREIKQRMHNRLGVFFTERGEPEKAAASFEACIAVDPESRFAAFAEHMLTVAGRR